MCSQNYFRHVINKIYSEPKQSLSFVSKSIKVNKNKMKLLIALNSIAFISGRDLPANGYRVSSDYFTTYYEPKFSTYVEFSYILFIYLFLCRTLVRCKKLYQKVAYVIQ